MLFNLSPYMLASLRGGLGVQSHGISVANVIGINVKLLASELA
jgi:hypothetical protein